MASATNTRSLKNYHIKHNPTSYRARDRLTMTSKTLDIPNYTPIHANRVGQLGGGLLIYMKHIIKFTDINIHTNINTYNKNYK